VIKNLLESAVGLVFVLIVVLFVTFPSTWLLMLFFGNIDLHLSYWGTLPMGILVSVLLGGASSGAYQRV
jgi:hypothetical protein